MHPTLANDAAGPINHPPFVHDMFMRSFDIHLFALSSVSFLCFCSWFMDDGLLSWIYLQIGAATLTIVLLRVLLQCSSVPDWAPTVLSYLMIGAYVFVSSVILYWGVYQVDLVHEFGGHPEKIWEKDMVLFYAVAPFVTMVAGIIVSTLSIPRWHTILLLLYSQLAIGAAAFTILTPALDELRTIELVVICQGTQQMALILGFGVGVKLVQGQQVYFDHGRLLA